MRPWEAIFKALWWWDPVNRLETWAVIYTTASLCILILRNSDKTGSEEPWC
jgi:hypothetical protein